MSSIQPIASKDNCENKSHAVELVGVKKSFGRQVVHAGIDLAVPKGATTVIIGASGAGKSVILKMIMGLLRPDSGEIRVFGQDVHKLGRRALRELRLRFGVLFQGVALFDSMSVYENVALPLRERTKMKEADIRASVLEKLELMGIEGAIDKYPSQLSGGMQKRVGLARALQMTPELVIFDEPTTGLDPDTTESIYDLFAQTQKKLGYTALIVSHDIPTIFRIADFVAVLHEGRMVALLPPSKMPEYPHAAVQHIVEKNKDWFKNHG